MWSFSWHFVCFLCTYPVLCNITDSQEIPFFDSRHCHPPKIRIQQHWNNNNLQPDAMGRTCYENVDNFSTGNWRQQSIDNTSREKGLRIIWMHCSWTCSIGRTDFKSCRVEEDTLLRKDAMSLWMNVSGMLRLKSHSLWFNN